MQWLGPGYYRRIMKPSEKVSSRLLDGKGFLYFRPGCGNWIFTVSLTEITSTTPWSDSMPSTVFDKPIDMQFGQRWLFIYVESALY